MDLPTSFVPWHTHASTVLVVHLVWCTRGRSPWLEPGLDGRLGSFLQRKAGSIDCHVLAVGVARDHVHLLLRHPPRISVAEAAHRLKGASSRALRPHLHPSASSGVWQVGYWAESVSPRGLDGLVTYVVNQRAHHAGRTQAEIWELCATSPPLPRARSQ